MDSPLPSNQELLDFSANIPWQDIEAQKRKFNQALTDIAAFDYNQAQLLYTTAQSDAIRAKYDFIFKEKVAFYILRSTLK